jgi:uncharacterized phage protein gp47/JayE
MAIFNSNGFQEDSLQTLIDNLQTEIKAIYGNDFDFDSSGTIGQLVNIISQFQKDTQGFITSLINNFDPDTAIGVALDKLLPLTATAPRKAGTFTLQDVDVVVNQSVSLQGLDTDINNINGVGFTVSNAQGTQFILANSISLIAGTHTLSFRAKELGKITTLSNTITNIDTVVLGVVSVNNPNTATEIGQDAELDSQVRIRRNRTLQAKAYSSLNSVYSALLNITGVTDVVVLENKGSTIDVNSQLPHSIWAIVEGGSNIDIATSIATVKSAGIDMNGLVSVDVLDSQNNLVSILFDRPTSKALYVRFDLKKTTATSFDLTSIKSYIINNTDFNISEGVNSTNLLITSQTAVTNIGGGGVPLNLQISKDNSNWFDYLDVDNVKEKWNLSDINIFITII